ncbi:S-(hydroxymethyl)glutathione synthase [Acinetobacter sp. WC-323]|uniref:GFA family protein n=1 Tax=Acinetobacter sp. WC-323 TaxID=903918 RepID=UPI00029E8220|nr:GFA family protein [Acinetobacter sp. WC-323]EKU54502.1 S-(hydroxymethyl)glutathione synthase [Acinetobacter sp. WC-323]
MQYKGSCHCGKLTFIAQGELTEALSCNCSICQKKGSLLWFLPQSEVEITVEDDAQATYQFNKHVIEHHFCKVCGIHPYAIGVDPQGNTICAINVRCIDDLELESIKINHFDGRSV